VERIKQIFNLQSSNFNLQSSIFNKKNKKTKFKNYLVLIWLLLIPSQLGRHFWLSESSVVGIRIDYLSIIFYLTDLVWLLWILRNKEIKKSLNSKNLNFKNLIFIIFIGINIILATAKWVALYRWLRIGQWCLTIKLLNKNKDEITKYLIKIVPWWIVVEAFLSLAQIVKGGSLNGIWWWLGERRFMYGGIGVAQFRVFDQAWIRAYGTFSHPNSLAGFLLLGWWFYRQLRSQGRQGFNKIVYWIVNWSAVMGIILSGSRIVWMLTVGMLIGEEILKSKVKSLKMIVGKMLLCIGVVCLVLGIISINYRISDFVGGWDVNSLEKREMLALSAIKMIRKSPLFGIGAGNFVVNLPKYQAGNFYWMQPVHNILLLAWSEIGILGIILLIFNLSTIGGSAFGGQSTIIKLTNNKYWWLWVIVGVTGFFDHYWLTLPQNSWLLAIVLGLI
jgi:hypothetical protein